MKKIFRALKFFYLDVTRQGFNRYASHLPSFDEEDKSPNFYSRLLGKIYRHFAIDYSERRRIRRFNRENDLKEHRILSEIVRYSQKLLVYIAIIVIIIFVADYAASFLITWLEKFKLLRQWFSLPTRAAISTGLIAYIGAISALLGLIFALYAVGFQLTTDRYSVRVTSFINNERVSSYFFQFLIFTDLMAIAVYLKLIIVERLPIVSFGITTIFVSLSLLGIIIFKNHFVEIIKPQSMFGRLRDLIWENVVAVSEPATYKQESWSIATTARKRVRDNFRVVEDLYRDLTRKDIGQGENWSDAAIAPLVAGWVLQGYTSRKRYIDAEKPWWSAQRYEKVKASNLTMYPLKRQHELKGAGPLFIPQNHPLWFEDMVFSFFDELEKDIHKDKNQLLLVNISEGYKTLLVGDKQQQIDAPPKTSPGAWQNQEIDIFDKGLKKFLALWRKVDICESLAAINYLNDYFGISTEIIEPWETKRALDIAANFYKNEQLNLSRKFMIDKELPTYIRKTLISSWQKLEVEQSVEGKIITPKARLLKGIEDDFKNEHTRLLEQYLSLFFDDSTELIKKLASCQKYDLMTQFIKMQMEWISHLMYEGYNDIAEKYSPKINDSAKYLLIIPKETLEEEELLEQVEKGFFVSLLEECRNTFAAYAKAIAIVKLKGTWEEKDQDKLFRELRLPIIWGSMAFALSELRQDTYWVKTFVLATEKTFNEGAFTQLMELTRDSRAIKNIAWETTRYLDWEQRMLRKINSELRQVPRQGAGELGFGVEFDHPSQFIRGLAEFDMAFSERAMEGFVEWLKKRDAIKELLEIILRGKKDG